MNAATLGPDPDDVRALTQLLDLMKNFPSNEQRARFLLSSNWMRDRGAAAAEHSSRVYLRLRYGDTADLPHYGEICSCGRPARVTFLTQKYGRTGFCGISNVPPLEPCTDRDCPQRVNRHDRAWCAHRRETTEANRAESASTTCL